MHRLSIAVTAIAAVAFAHTALAADMPTKAPAVRASVVVPYNWTGFYVGANAGYSWMNSTDDITAVTPGAIVFLPQFATSVALDPKGFIGGAQFGYNWQAPGSVWVVGVETDIAWADLKKTVSLVSAGPNPRTITASEKLDWLGTLRARLGWTPTDRWLAYVTGGLAYGQASLSTALTRVCGGLDNCQAGSVSTTRAGWTIGGGLEWAFANNWSVKAEYLYFDLGSVSHLMTDQFFPANVFNASADLKGSIARAGVNYHF